MDNLTPYDQINRLGADIESARNAENARNIEKARIAAEHNAENTMHIDSTVSGIDGRLHALNSRVDELNTGLESERIRAGKAEKTALIISIISIIIALVALAVDIIR